ncbi:hypothetical protein NPIL_181961 [Nephila pilipes]|uniref:Uncharacterized protein n=1 Tax=Nephila pilipes TaxID=299642 RepID=A0A8X6SYI0_NEPPI|nr:hypothetical protein NPIL_181961 [Nephila pilipes]
MGEKWHKWRSEPGPVAQKAAWKEVLAALATRKKGRQKWQATGQIKEQWTAENFTEEGKEGTKQVALATSNPLVLRHAATRYALATQQRYVRVIFIYQGGNGFSTTNSSLIPYADGSRV